MPSIISKLWRTTSSLISLLRTWIWIPISQAQSKTNQKLKLTILKWKTPSLRKISNKSHKFILFSLWFIMLGVLRVDIIIRRGNRSKDIERMRGLNSTMRKQKKCHLHITWMVRRRNWRLLRLICCSIGEFKRRTRKWPRERPVLPVCFSLWRI